MSTQYRVLIVDNEQEIRDEAKRQLLSYLPDACIYEAATQREATSLMRAHYLDAAVVDIKLDVEAAGFEVVRQLARHSPHAAVLVATKYLDVTTSRQLLRLVSLEAPRVVRIADKRTSAAGALNALQGEIDAWRSAAVPTTGMDLMLQLLHKRHKRYPGLRTEPEEREVELERLIRQLFGEARGAVEEAGVGVTFLPIERQGLSAAFAVVAEVHLGSDVAGRPVDGNVTVLKIGPAEDVLEEANRYLRFVKYGVKLAHRVELLATATEKSLGGIVYSFAGGVFGEDLVALDDALGTPSRRHIALQAIGRMFDPKVKNWYGVRAGDESALSFVERVYRTDFERSYTDFDNAMRKIARRFRLKIDYTAASESEDGELIVGDTKLVVPRHSYLGHGHFLRAYPACLVHGDMHGGNVLLELDNDREAPRERASETLRRVCLIDYRNAGPGPRTIDAVALEATIRLADAENLSGQAEPTAPASDDELLSRLTTAAKRVKAERELLGDWPPTPIDLSPSDVPDWLLIVRRLRALLYENFGDMESPEYEAVSFIYALRLLGFSIGPVARVRTVAWLDALYGSLRSHA